ncbi:tRNA (cytosine(72)-C(5))-methyltransferase NSUN6 [Lepeophtheirus salmonis]|uniref:SAM-dependent MTase RsmB/NOP-type domain-containing protein n=1 Tax=Lepeophtheirus salmonis TaxID=72036 RepID=A0A0K2UAK1_LEPSM|nr:tRNA (cytosine(72)-C(5))-methyltransferase NSUN6-like [Lepeophtheirus salmonis]
MALDELCLDGNVSQELRKCVSAGGFKDEETLVQWLTSAPSLTTLRISKGKHNDTRDPLDVKVSLEDFILKQYRERGLTQAVPQISFWDGNNHDILKIEALDTKDSFSGVTSNGYVIVDKYCGSSVLRGANIYVKGILGMSFNIKENDIVNVLVDVDGKCLKGSNAPILPASNFVKIGIGKSLHSRKVIFKSIPQGVGVLMMNTPHPSLDLPQEMESSLFPQNYPSIFTVLALRLTEKERISMLDMCSSPGGKTLHASEILQGLGGYVLAVDKSTKKIETIRKNLEKYGIENVSTLVGDGRTLCDSLHQTFDRILVDAPCSALGQRACFRIQMKFKEMLSYPKVQKRLLDSAVGLLRPGGLLVYSTCTITLGENEDNCSWLLNKYKGILEVDITNPMLDGVGYKRFSCFDHIGFFVAAFRKKEH